MAAALVLFAHGSRDPNWAAPFRALRERIERAAPALVVELAFLELMQPTLGEAIDRLVAAGHDRVIVAPLFMAQGAHLKRDLTTLLLEVQSRHAAVDVQLLPAVGEVDSVLEAMADWLIATAHRTH